MRSEPSPPAARQAARGASPHAPHLSLVIRRLGRADYVPTWQAMKDFTLSRSAGTLDELWVVEHPPVYTVGQAGRPQHLPRRSDIPVVPTDRGGQITYHGPGQIVVYLLLDLRRLKLAVRPLVRRMEQAVIDLLSRRGIQAYAREEAPGVYVEGAKIAALGLRIRNGCCYHGLAFNVDMDLSPFEAIDPCGYRGLPVTQARNLGITDPIDALAEELVQNLAATLFPNPVP
ncbi:MAG: octanoyltransferase [Azospira oryzae]|nr:MAG: octanoyltransferase [Azospira oryzae]PZP59575.1 MAG: octanoyltransferase [Delftia acidovorans]PZP79771.1 MAG: octanoyltransferase [Azospira oryzae]